MVHLCVVPRRDRCTALTVHREQFTRHGGPALANKTRKYIVSFGFKATGNREPLFAHETAATTVQRAISKLVKDINDGKWEAAHKDNVIPQAVELELQGDDVRASDLLVIEVSINGKR